jgi:hypothetical protein
VADLDGFFRGYAEAFNRMLDGTGNAREIAKHFTDEMIAAGPAGVRGGKNDETFIATLERGFEFYRSIGTRHMAVKRVDTIAIDEGHDLAKVSYRADYRKKNGKPVSVEFTVSYLTHADDAGPRIFAFISGDEMAVYRRLGLTD